MRKKIIVFCLALVFVFSSFGEVYASSLTDLIKGLLDGNKEVETTIDDKNDTADDSKASQCEDQIHGQMIIPGLGHDLIITEKVEASCITEGVMEYYTCSRCGKTFSDAEGKKEINVADLIIKATGHSLYKNPAVDATCTTEGSIEYYSCSVCGQLFQDESGGQAISLADTEVAAKGHTEVKDAAVAATCTSPGKTEGSHCSVCNTVTTPQQEIAAKGHTIVKVDFVSPTVEHVGNKEYWKCSVCGIFFGDAAGKTEIEKDSWVIDKIDRVTGVTLDKTSAECGMKKTLQLTATVSPSTANPKVTWASSDTEIATVDSNGLVTFKDKRGKVTISVKTEDGSYYAVCNITVQFNDCISLNDSFKEAINWAADKGIATGFDSGSFGQANACTRRQFIIMLYRFAGKPEVSGEMPFTDCVYSKKSDSYKAILWASKANIVKGYDDGSFKPENVATRKDVLVMLYRYAGKPEVKGEINYSDVTYEKDSLQYKAILWGVKKGIAKGYDDGHFGVNEKCLRRQVVLFLYRFSKKIK